MSTNVTPEMLTMIYQFTALGVSIILAGGGIGFAIGCGVVCGKTMECYTRLPDTRATLMMDMFVFTGFVSNFPFIVLAFGSWFLFANPFVDTLKAAADALVNEISLAQ
ncbi:ATP synthase subunit c [Gammaproteobacteria bacterium]